MGFNDFLLHVRDISHPQTHEQQEDVEQVLSSLGITDKYHHQTITILNKIDKLDYPVSNKEGIPVSARTGANLEQLLEAVDDFLKQKDHLQECKVPISDGSTIAWIYEHAEVVSRKDEDHELVFTLRISEKHWAQLQEKL